jgi:L-threonylcarbamoyladenylate synthase
MQKAVDKCVEVLREGGIILYPTDTIWGIGCDATNEEAVAKVYAMKQSEDKHSMLCLCRDADMVVRYVNRAPGIAFEVMELSDKPLTAILPGATGVAKSLIPETGTLGVRIPQHDFCQALLRKFGKPIVSTSANISGEEAAKRLKDVDERIIKGVDYVVNPRFEGKPTLKPSAIISFGEGGEVEIIRK